VPIDDKQSLAMNDDDAPERSASVQIGSKGCRVLARVEEGKRLRPVDP
jgi:hypothetical protein